MCWSIVRPVWATCPVCVVAIGSGLWLARVLGVDDLIVSLWIGGAIAALAIVFAEKIRRQQSPLSKIVWTLIFYLTTLGVLKIQGKLDNPFCQIWGINKIFLGVTLGIFVFFLGVGLDKLARKKQQGRVYFPFQKVVFPVGAVLLLSLILHLLVC